MKTTTTRVSLLDPIQDPPRGKYRAQWNDDYHHAWHVKLTGEKQGYYRDYQRAPLSDIARCLGSGFAYQGEASEHRGGKLRGEPSGGLPPTAFVNFLQNHDQIGNRAFGDRLEGLAKPEAIEAALAITLLAPAIPMLFMGEEWGSKAPFPFFCDFKGGLAEAVRKGRRDEYAWAYATYGDDVPDPLSEATFRSAILDWESWRWQRARTAGAGARTVGDTPASYHAASRGRAFRRGARGRRRDYSTADWRMGDGARLSLRPICPTADHRDRDRPTAGHPDLGPEPGQCIKPWSVIWRLEAR